MSDNKLQRVPAAPTGHPDDEPAVLRDPVPLVKRSQGREVAGPLARHLYFCLVTDIRPNQSAVIDYGIASDDHYRALRWAVWHGGRSVEDLHNAAGDGEALQRLVKWAPFDVQFSTPEVI